MEIVKVTEENIFEAGKIHADSWRESHKDFCSEEVVARHTKNAQTEYLRSEQAKGKEVYMLIDSTPIGIVSVQNSLIENLYVLPSEQRKGYGTRLLQYAIHQCRGIPTLWILSNNKRARAFYKKHGFSESGNIKQRKNNLFEIELVLHREESL